MERAIDTDVVVIGAGPTGLTAAALLADYGLRVVVLERHPSTGDEPRAISITDESLRILQQLGVLDELKPEMLLDTGARYFGRRDQLIAEVRPSWSRLGQPGKSQFDQPDLEAALGRVVAARENATLLFQSSVVDVRDTEQGVHVDAETPDGALAVNAKWLIACDGGRSFTRSVLGIHLEGSTQVEKWIVIDVLGTPGVPQPFAEFHCNGVRPVVVVPGVKGRRRYEFMLLPGDDEQEIVTPASVVRLVGPFQTITESQVRRAAVYVAQQRIASRYREGHILLAGDAAHLMPPFAGQGLNAGLRDAANAAWKVAEAVHGTGTDALIDTYATERRPHTAEMVRLSHLIGQVVMSRRAGLNRLRDAAVDAVGIVPSWKQWLTGMRFLKQPRYTDGCAVRPDRRLGSAAVQLWGWSLAQPTVTTPEGERVPLDEVLGTGWALLRPWANGELDVTSEAGEERRVTDPSLSFAGAAGGCLVVRPDRYVAAVAQPASLPDALRGLSRFSTRPARLAQTATTDAGRAPR